MHMEIPKSFINMIKSTSDKPYGFKSGKQYEIHPMSNNGITATFVQGFLKSSMPNMEINFPYEIASDPQLDPTEISYNKNFDKMKEIFNKYFSQSITETFQVRTIETVANEGFTRTSTIHRQFSNGYNRYKELVNNYYWRCAPVQNMISVFIYIIDTDTDHSEFIKNRLKSINYPIDFVVINLCDTISFPKPNIESFSLEALKKFIDNARKYFIFDVKEIPVPITETGDNRDTIDTNVKSKSKISKPKEITVNEQGIINRSKDIASELKNIINLFRSGSHMTFSPEHGIIKKINDIFLRSSES